MRTLGGISRNRQMLYFIFFTSISFLFALLAYYLPFGYAIRLVFTDYDAISPPTYVGLSNFKELLHDNVFWISLRNTFVYALYVVPAVLVTSFFVAIGLNRRTKIIVPLRIFYFLPMVTSSIAVSLVWKWMFNPDYGILNNILGILNIPKQNWLSNPHLALLSLAFVGIWGNISYYTILFLAGLQNIPDMYYEAAKIDGASRKDMLFHITIPLISPITFFVLIMSTIGVMQIFDSVFIMTSGGPGYSTYTLVYYIYRNGFYWFRMGYGVTISWVLYGILLLLTAIQFKVQRKWVYYE